MRDWNWEIVQMIRKFPTFRSERKKRTTSGGSPQFPNGFSEKLLFHLTFNRNFRIFWLNGKHPSLGRGPWWRGRYLLRVSLVPKVTNFDQPISRLTFSVCRCPSYVQLIICRSDLSIFLCVFSHFSNIQKVTAMEKGSQMGVRLHFKC